MGVLVVVIASLAIVEYLRLRLGDRLRHSRRRRRARSRRDRWRRSAPRCRASGSPRVWRRSSLGRDDLRRPRCARTSSGGLTRHRARSLVGVLYRRLLLPHFIWLRHSARGIRSWVTFVIAIGNGRRHRRLLRRARVRAPQAGAAPQPGEDRRGRRGIVACQPARRRHCQA